MRRLWSRLAWDLKPRQLDRIARRIRFAALESAFKAAGRMVVDFSLR